jgi:hypothetical protein
VKKSKKEKKKDKKTTGTRSVEIRGKYYLVRDANVTLLLLLFLTGKNHWIFVCCSTLDHCLCGCYCTAELTFNLNPYNTTQHMGTKRNYKKRNNFSNTTISFISGIFFGLFIALGYTILFSPAATLGSRRSPTIEKFQAIKGQLASCESHLHTARASLTKLER